MELDRGHTQADLIFREAELSDLHKVLELLVEGSLNSSNTPSLTAAKHQFERMISEGSNKLYVAEIGSEIVACYQMALIFGVSVDAGCRAHIEGVRVAEVHRRKGVGTILMADIERRAREAGARTVQLMSNNDREAAHRFYVRLGYIPSHTGFKRRLSA